MDFVDNLGDTSGTLEIAVDALGRAELLNDRVRLTLVTQRCAAAAPAPAVCLVWTVAGLKRNRERYSLLYDLLTRGALLDPAEVHERLHH